MVRTIVIRVDARAARVEQADDMPMHLVDDRLGEKPRATPDWLVVTTTGRPAWLSARTASMLHGKSATSRTIEISDLFDERAVAIEEHGDCVGSASQHLPHRADHAVNADASHAPVIDADTRAACTAGTRPGASGRRAASPAGRVCRSSVGPKIAVTGTPSAAAEVHRAESFDTSARQCASTPASAGRSVRHQIQDDVAAERGLDLPRDRQSARPPTSTD